MARVLVVDDVELIRNSLARVLQKAGHACELAADVPEARDLLARDAFDLVLCDIHMPGPSGLDLLKQIATELPNTATVMVTGVDDPVIADTALRTGAYGYVVKPFRANEIIINVSNALRRLHLEQRHRLHAEELETKLLERNVSLRHAMKELENHDAPWKETLDLLSRALALRDEETGRHIERVGLYSSRLAQVLGLDKGAVATIQQASMLHDAGKIGIPDAILTKPGKLTEGERVIVERHAELGFQLLSGSTSPTLDVAASIALTHHEWWDGTGYPRALRGDEIPIEGRIVAIADVFDALTSNRIYRPAFDLEEALRMMRSEKATHFDPETFEIFESNLDGFLAIRDQHPDDAVGPQQTSVLVFEVQELLAEALMRLLEASPGLWVIGRASSVEEAVRLAEDTAPDVALIDWDLIDPSGTELCARLRAVSPSTKGVVLSDSPGEAVLVEAIEAGCSAVLTKTRPFDEVAQAIRAAHAGEMTLPIAKLSSVLERIRTPATKGARVGDLTARELEVLALLAQGLSNDAIAERLVLSLNTVRNHVQRIIMKLGAHSKLEAVTLALRRGIVPLPELSLR